MKRDTLKWVLVAAVVVAATAYLYFSERKPNEKQGRRKARTEQVAIAEGHSKAFKIEPVEGITISAPKNALDKDREFKISPVSEKEWERSTKKVQDVAPGTTPFLCFDLDAGMKPDEVMPGCFLVSLDLDKMGIPLSLRDRLSVWRDGGNEVYEYTSWVENGKLCFRGDQNSPIVVALVTLGSTLPLFYIGETVHKHMATGDLYKYFFMQNDDAVVHRINDEYGDFTLYFRYKDTEWANRFDSYKYNAEAFAEQLQKLEKQADAIYDNRVDSKYKKELGDMNFWQRLVGSRAAYERSAEAVNRMAILDSLCNADTKLDEYKKGMELPPSIKDIENFLKISNRYLTDDQQLKPQTRNLEVDLVNSEHAGSSNAEYRHTATKHPYMFVNYDLVWMRNPEKNYVRKGWPESVLLSINHELFHHRQKISKWIDFRTEETTAAYNETAAAHYFFQEEEMKTNLLAKDKASRKFIKDNFALSGRDNYEVFGLPFNTNTTDPTIAYTYADFMDYLQLKTTGSETEFTICRYLVSLYRYSSSHKANYMRWFMIEDGKDFDKYLGEFLHLNVGKVRDAQCSALNKGKAFATKEMDLTASNPIVKVKTCKGELLMRTIDFSTGSGLKAPKCNLFIVADKEVSPDELSFSITSDWFKTDSTGKYIHSVQGNYLAGNESVYSVAYYKVPSKSLKFSVVALFAPDSPEIRRVKEDQISFIMPKPARELTKNKLITGAVVTYKDTNGQTHTHDIKPKYFGKKVKWTVSGCSKENTGFTLSLHWYYKPDETTTYDSPESEPVKWGNYVMIPEAKEEETKAPETNYWKRVSIRGNMVTSGKVEEKLDGVDFVNPDYRFVEMKQQDMGSFEIEGWAAVNTSKDERIYERTLSLDGELSMTAPPEFWVPGAEYAGVWSMEQDPYVAKIGDPFGFKAEITTTSDKACTASRKAKTDTGRSNHGGSPWIRKYSGTFMARFPEGDAPRAFSLTQTFEVAERPGSGRKALVTYIYDYEWVGEPEEEVEEEPDGSYWKLVKVYEDDTKAKYENRGKGDWYQLFDITGGGSRFNLKIEQTMYGNSGSVSQSASIVAPKQIYHPGESVAFDYTLGEPSISGHSFNGGAADIYVLTLRRVLTNKQYKLGERGNEGIGGAFVSRQYPNPDLSSMIVPAHDEWFNTFTIVDRARAGAGATEVWHSTVYEYQWVEAGQKPKQENVSGGHWKLSNTVVSNEPGMMNGGSDIVTVQGGNGNYNAHVERDGEISDREIRFDKPKTVYRPGEQITLNITNDKAKTKNTKDGIVYGVVDFSTAQPGQSTDYPAMDKHPGYNSGKVKGTATGVAPQSGKPGVVDFSITEQIMVKGSYTKTHTTYYYVWEE